MIKFYALPVKEGDSFLLQHNEKSILVDTGKDAKECKILCGSITENLDAVIITHYDADHVNGLYELINSNVKINELWLPENFGRISKTLREKKNSVLQYITKTNTNLGSNLVIAVQSHMGQLLFSMDEVECETKLFQSGNIREKANNLLFSDQRDDSIIVRRMPLPGHYARLNCINITHIQIIDDIVKAAENKNIHIRWLTYKNEIMHNQIDNSLDLFGLNCEQVNQISEYSDDDEALFYLTQINKESFVFLFENKDMPNVLFSADSGFQFLGKKKLPQLKNYSIITAPHHGSTDKLNRNVYTLVNGINLIYIRSDKLSPKRPCSEYKQQNNKYCTYCNTNSKGPVQVELTFDGETWVTNNMLCSCI